MRQAKACILGGSGFVGGHLARRLAKAGYHCIVPSRHPQRHRDMELFPDTELRRLPNLSPAALADCFQDVDLVVNLTGILNETGGASFQGVHVDLVRELVKAARKAGVSRLLHMSALNAHADQGTSAYLRSKGEGERIALNANAGTESGVGGLKVTSFRPSVIFGRGDSFFNRFAQLLEMTPGVFPLACPNARFAPVWVGDVAEAMVRCIDDEQSFGRRYDLCGPRIFTLEELVKYTAKRIDKKVTVMGLGNFGSKMQARALQLVPGKPFSMDNYLSMQTDSICGERNGLMELRISPKDPEAVVPTYLG